PLVIRNDQSAANKTILFGLAFMVLGGGMTAAMYQSGFPGPAFVGFFPLLFFGGFGLLAFLVGARSLYDRKRKLTVDQEGITDHRAGGRDGFTPWASIHSIDWRIHSRGGELIVYLVAPGGAVSTRTIDISGLEGGPSRIATEIKKLWIELE